MECMQIFLQYWNNSHPHRKTLPLQSTGMDISTALDRVSLHSYKR